MRERFVLYGVVALLCVAVITGWSPVARAVTPTGPVLEDANGTYLGQLLSVYHDAPDQVISYTTYLPAVNGILQFNSGANGPEQRFDNHISQELYDQANCQGNAYIPADQQPEFIHPWIVQTVLNNNFYKVASTSRIITPESFDNGGGCEPYTGVEVRAYRLNPVTLPFDPNTVALPYKIRQ